MSSALVVGERGAGLTTFVGLLYTAQVRLGTEESDEFRFSADRETINQLEGIYGELGAGRFPVRDVNWEEHPLSFVLGFRNGRLGSLTRRRSEEEGGFGTVRVTVGGISTEELAELRVHDAILASPTRRLLSSQVVIPLVDASRLLPEPENSGSPALAQYDRQLAATLDLIGRFLASDRRRRARKMYPLFVLTKLDQCPRATLAQILAPAGPPSGWLAEDRARVGREVLERYLPQTRALVAAGRGRTRLACNPPEWYFSSLQLTDEAGVARIHRRSIAPVGGWEPEYLFEEYRALIERLARLARQLPRPVEN